MALTCSNEVVLLQKLLTESSGLQNFSLLLHLQQLCAEIKEAVSFRHLALSGTLAKLLTAVIKFTQDLLVEATVLFPADLTAPSCRNGHLAPIFDVPLTPSIFEDVPYRFCAREPDLEQLRCLLYGDMLIFQQEIDQDGPLLIADSLVASLQRLALFRSFLAIFIIIVHNPFETLDLIK